MASPLSDAPFAPGLVSGREALADVRPEEVGGKAWNLFRLREAGFPVPPWIVVTASGVEPLMKPARARLLGLLRQGTPDETAAEQIQGLLPSVAWPGERELRRRIEAEWGRRVRLAVRSSVVGEDSREHSYAGLMETRLNVAAEDLGEAVRAVCASAFSARALLYRRRKGIALSGIATAVVVQELVPAAAAGVAFSREPETGDRRCVITAGYGLGEGIVSDRVEVDTYRIGWRCDRVERQVVAKESRVSPAGTGWSACRGGGAAVPFCMRPRCAGCAISSWGWSACWAARRTWSGPGMGTAGCGSCRRGPSCPSGAPRERAASGTTPTSSRATRA
jgi:phosphoenolpyruvate synthase/pyruvate phosphate dikinase